MSHTKLFVVVGSGPGIGVAAALKFASEGFNVALLSRNTDRLLEDAAKVKQVATNDVRVDTFPTDATDHVALKTSLEEVQRKLGSPEVVLYNTARVAPSTFGETTPEQVLDDLKLTSVGLYVTASWAFPLMTELAKSPNTKPSFLLTSTNIQDLPGAMFFSLFMGKAAQRNFMGAFNQIAGPAGVHVARSEINGTVADDNPELNAKNIAEGLYGLSRQEKSQWQQRVELGKVEDFVRQMSGGL